MNKNHIPLLKRFSKAVIKHPAVLNAENTVQQAMDTSMITGESTSAIITGESGMGKSTFCKKVLMKKFPEPHTLRTDNAVINVVPVLFCAVPAQITIKSMAKSLLKGLEETDFSGDTISLTYRIINLLEIKRTEIIILDEFHHLLKSDASKVRESVCQWVKQIIDEAHSPMVISGLPKCADIIRENRELSRRFPFQYEMRNFRYSASSQSVFVKMLTAFSNLMLDEHGVKIPVDFTHTTLIKQLYCATAGNLDSITTLLLTTFRQCLENGDKKIDQKSFSRAFEVLDSLICLTNNNPFDMSTSDIDKVIANAST